MVPAKLSAIHRTGPDESLHLVAAKFRLGSWRAVAFAPGNEHIAGFDRLAALPPGTVLRIPPKAHDLLKERVYLLHRVRAALDREFRTHHSLFVRDIASGPLPEPLTDPAVVRALLGNLQSSLEEVIEQTRAACCPFAFINSGLVITHLHNDGDLRRYVGGDDSIMGFYWLLEPPLVDAWSGMWSVDYWVSRWDGCDRETAVDRADKHLNVIRSKVLQQVDSRLRQALAAMSELERERAG